MVTVRVCSEIKKSLKSVVSTIKVGKNSRYFVSVFNKKIQFRSCLLDMRWLYSTPRYAPRWLFPYASHIQRALVG